MYEQGVHVSTVSPDISVAGLFAAGLLTREIEDAASKRPVRRVGGTELEPVPRQAITPMLSAVHAFERESHILK